MAKKRVAAIVKIQIPAGKKVAFKVASTLKGNL